MTTPTLHRTERRTEFPPEQYVSAKKLETFFHDFHPFRDSAERAAKLFREWLEVSCNNSEVTLVIWCVQCYRHHEHCRCGSAEANLDQWRILKDDLVKMRGPVEREAVVFGGYGNIYTLEFSEYIKTHSQ